VDINAYLKRINYRGQLAPTAETLRALQVAHLRTVPFENLSIHNSEPIILNDDALFAKIVERRRGGFCYECNGLFAALLRALGFDVSMLSAEVAIPAGGFSKPFAHMTLMVKLEQLWLADVGFGDSFVEPLLLDEEKEQVQGNHAYRIISDGEYRVLSRRAGDEWTPQYRFTLRPYAYEDYAEMCAYHQTSPQSHFTQKRICSLATEAGGRISISDLLLIITSANGERTERTLRNEEEYAAVLRENFGIELT
jgi:N-hydroxyarylamine O-acetyltransferase